MQVDKNQKFEEMKKSRLEISRSPMANFCLDEEFVRRHERVIQSFLYK